MSHQVKKRLGVTLGARGSAEFRVWAPFADLVQIGGTFTPHGLVSLDSEGDGYWSIKIKGVEPGNLYKYHITTQDGRKIERNDPRARAITSSDKGLSVVVDNDFDWGDTTPVAIPKNQQVIYEMHIGTFNRPDSSTTGTFESAIERLDYLVELGVTTVELMPVTSMAYSNGWGYAPNYIYSVESMLGGRHGLMSFVRACHERGMGVILDVVYNHFYGDSDLWQFDGWSENGRGGIYFYNDERGDTPWGGRPDYGRPEVRQFILDNVTMWFNEYKLDGLRVDSTIYLRNTEGKDNDPWHDLPEAWGLLQDITRLAHKLNPNALVIAEDCASNEFITKSRRSGGAQFDAQWALGFPYGIREALASGDDSSLDGIAREFNWNFNSDPFQKVIFSDSHDSAANGSARLNDQISPRDPTSLVARQKTLLADAITLTAPGIPMILQGSEFLQEGAFNDWQALDWNLVDKYHGFWLAHCHLIALRRNIYGNTPELAGTDVEITHMNNQHLVLAYSRKSHSEDSGVMVVMNLGNNNFDKYDIHFPTAGKWLVRFNSTWKGYDPEFADSSIKSVSTRKDLQATLPLPGYSCLILSKE